MAKGRKFWTLEEDAVLFEHYANMSTPEVLKFLPEDATYNSTRHRAALLGLKKTPEVKQQLLYKAQTSARLPNVKRYKYGALRAQYPWIRKIRKSKREVYEVTVDDGKWVLLHRAIWQHVFGPIPEGFTVRFKDGIKANLEPDNLYLFAQADIMRIAKTAQDNYPEELKEIMNLAKQLKRRINNGK